MSQLGVVCRNFIFLEYCFSEHTVQLQPGAPYLYVMHVNNVWIRIHTLFHITVILL